MEEGRHSLPLLSPPPLPPQHPRKMNVDEADGDNNNNNDILPEVILDILLVDIMTYFDVQTLVEIKLVSRQWRCLATTAIDGKGIETKQRKAFETNDELRNAVKRYCPLPKGGIHETTKQEYCDREIAEDIACTYGWPINKWDVSQIQDFSNVFDGGETRWNDETDEEEYVDGIVLFNEDISDWDVSKARTMERMFNHALNFNQDLSDWEVFNVTDMRQMFCHAENFNQDISSWYVENVTNMSYMFADAGEFNQNLSEWRVSVLTPMNGMFYNATRINQDMIASWNDRWNARRDLFQDGSSEDSDGDDSNEMLEENNIEDGQEIPMMEEDGDDNDSDGDDF